MLIMPQDCIDVIEKEIDWCENNRDKGIYSDDENINKKCQDEFINGLKQAKLLIQNLMVLR